MSMKYIRKTYGVPAKRGMFVEIYSDLYRWRYQCVYRGYITSASNYIHVNGIPFHPTKCVVYYDDKGNVIKDTREWKK